MAFRHAAVDNYRKEPVPFHLGTVDSYRLERVAFLHAAFDNYRMEPAPRQLAAEVDNHRTEQLSFHLAAAADNYRTERVLHNSLERVQHHLSEAERSQHCSCCC